MMKKGFTLVELSIVLVIIGLLIGGILVAQSLIESAKVSKLARDLSSYGILAKQFKDRYRYLPGDAAPGFPARPSRGGTYHQDGQIVLTSEMSGFWNDLYLAGMVDVAYDGAGTIGYDSAKGKSIPELEYLHNDTPSSPEGKVGLLARYTVPTNGIWTAGGRDHLYGHSGNYIAVIGNQQGQGALTAEQAFAVDKKIDDSRPGTGKYITAPVVQQRFQFCTKNGSTLLESGGRNNWSGLAKDVDYRFDTPATNCALLHWID